MNGMTLNFASFADSIQKELDAADKKNRAKASVFAQRKLREAAPRKTGNLRKSIKTKHNNRSSAVGFAKPLGSHAHLVEHGHDIIRKGVKVGHVQAHPFFKPAWDAMLPELEKIMSEAML